jgi:hypothetical protein
MIVNNRAIYILAKISRGLFRPRLIFARINGPNGGIKIVNNGGIMNKCGLKGLVSHHGIAGL